MTQTLSIKNLPDLFQESVRNKNISFTNHYHNEEELASDILDKALDLVHEFLEDTYGIVTLDVQEDGDDWHVYSYFNDDAYYAVLSYEDVYGLLDDTSYDLIAKIIGERYFNKILGKE